MRKTLIVAALALAPAVALPQGYGPGMEMGYGNGMGMSAGMGGGMMAGGGLMTLGLSDAQAEKIFAIQDGMHAKNWETMRKMRSEAFKLGRLVYAEKVDTNAVAEQQKKVDELRRQMLKAHLETRQQIEAVLTPEQRKRMRGYGPWMHGEGG